jgi:hypothetical protein
VIRSTNEVLGQPPPNHAAVFSASGAGGRAKVMPENVIPPVNVTLIEVFIFNKLI